MRSEVALVDALELVIDYRGKTPKKLGGDFANVGVPVVSAINVKDGRIAWQAERRYVSDEMHAKWMQTRTREGDVLLTSEAPLGEVALVANSAPLVLGQRIFGLRAKAGLLNGGYLYYALQHPVMQSRLAARSTGTTVLGIRQSELLKVTISLPPIREQEDVAGILAAVDRTIDANTLLIRRIEDYLREEFDSRFGSLPAASTVGALVENVRTTVKPGGVDASTPYIGLEHMPRGSVVLAQWDAAGQATSNKSAYQHGDLLFGKLRPYFKKSGVALTDGVCSSDILVCRPRDDAWFGFMLILLSSDPFIAYTNGASTGTRMPRASWKDVSRYPVAVPPRDALSQFNLLAKASVKRFETAVNENRHLRHLRSELLGALIEGKVTAGDVRKCFA